MKRRTFLAALAAAALTVQLAGCAAGTTQPASSVVTPQASAPADSHLSKSSLANTKSSSPASSPARRAASGLAPAAVRSA